MQFKQEKTLGMSEKDSDRDRKGGASKCLSRDFGITLEEMVVGMRVVEFPWACGQTPLRSHDGFHPDD